MDESPEPSRRPFRAAAYSLLALASLFGGASLPEANLSSGSRLVVGILGFAGYLLSSRLAIRNWWPGMDRLWRDDGPNLSAAMIAMVPLARHAFRA